jgi:arylsulfatase A-like enzyme
MFLGCGGSEVASERPDVLLVVLDTVRADRTSSYGYARPTTPQLDAVALAGVLFEDVTAPGPWTWPSHASLFTGEPPWVHGARFAAAAGSQGEGAPTQPRFGMQVTPMRDDLPTLAERFAAAGYETAAFVVNDWLAPELGITRGFSLTRVFRSDADATRAAREWIAGDRAAPAFLFVNLLSAHAPFRDGPGPWALEDASFFDPEHEPAWAQPYLVDDGRGVSLQEIADGDESNGVMRFVAGDLEIPPAGMRSLSHLYDSGVRAADFALGRVLEAWVARYPEAVVAVTSDHGEHLGERGLLDHRSSVYPETLRVPLVIAAPGRFPAGTRVSSPVNLERLHPTLLELAGLHPTEGSLVPLLEDDRASEVVSAAAWPDALWSRRIGGRFSRTWRLYRDATHALVNDDENSAELYDLVRDPGMTRDLAADQPERVADLRRRARDHFGASVEEVAPLEIPAEIQERLSTLGYLD